MNNFAISTIVGVALVSVPAQAADEAEKGILAAIGLTAATGKTTLADGSGALEGEILASPLIPEAATEIDKKISNYAGTTLILTGDQTLDLGLTSRVSRRIDRLKRMVPSSCPKKKDGTSIDGGIMSGEMSADAGGGRSATDVASAVIGAFKVDSEVRSFAISAPDQALVSALAALKPTYIVPSEYLSPAEGGRAKVGESFQSLMDNLDYRSSCKDEAIAARVTAVRAAADALDAPGEKGAPSLLEEAIRLEGFDPSKTRILRIKSAAAGGTIINRSNIFLQLGFPGAVGIRSGLVVDFRLSDPEKGTVTTQGRLVCRRHKESNLNGVYGTKLKMKVAAGEASCGLAGS